MHKNIVLLHGWGANALKLERLSKNLAKLGWKVYTPDLPGFGKNTLEKSYTLKDYAKFIAVNANRNFKGKKFVIFGHSNGGRIAIAVCKFFPKNLNAIVLCASGGISRTFILKRMVFWIIAKLGKILVVFPRLANLFKKILYKSAREHDYEKADGYLKETFRNLINSKSKKMVKDINVPTLILWGKKDKLTPYKDAIYLKKKINKSELITYVNVGHRLPYEKPEAIASEIDLWISRKHI